MPTLFVHCTVILYAINIWHEHNWPLTNLCLALTVVYVFIFDTRKVASIVDVFNFSFDDEAMGAHMSDVNLLSIGFCLVFFYLSFSMGSYSCIEQKVYNTVTHNTAHMHAHTQCYPRPSFILFSSFSPTASLTNGPLHDHVVLECHLKWRDSPNIFEGHMTY